MGGEDAVDEGLLAGEELEHVAVAVEEGRGEAAHLLDHRGAQRPVPRRELLLVVEGVGDRPDEEPLAGEVVDQRGRLGVADHPQRLGLEDRRLAELAGLGEVEELVVRHRAPQEVREA